MHGQTVKPVPRINASCAPGHHGDAPDSAAAVRPRSSDANPPSHYKRNVAPASARPLDYYNARMHAAQASHGGSAAVAGRAKILDGATGRAAPSAKFSRCYHRCCHGRFISVSSSPGSRISARQAVIFVRG